MTEETGSEKTANQRKFERSMNEFKMKQINKEREHIKNLTQELARALYMSSIEIRESNQERYLELVSTLGQAIAIYSDIQYELIKEIKL